MKKVSFLLFIMLLTVCVITPATASEGSIQTEESIMQPTIQLGNFSVSLAVKDIAVSRAFYEKLGFTIVGGDQEKNWLVMKNGDTKIGLFQGMFEGNILTFNPGWDSDGEKLSEFTDIRELQRKFKAHDIELLTEADEATTGPASFMLKDPDGNQVLVDQHVPALD